MKHSQKEHLHRSKVVVNHEIKRIYIRKSNSNLASCGHEQMYKFSLRDFNDLYKMNNDSVCKKCLTKRNELIKEAKQWITKGYR